MISRNERSVIHTVILTMSSDEPPAAAMTRRTFSNISRHCSSRSAGTCPVAGPVPEIAPDTTKGPRRLALGMGLTCFAPATSMLRRFSMDHLRFTLYANSRHHLDDIPRESLHSKTRALEKRMRRGRMADGSHQAYRTRHRRSREDRRILQRTVRPHRTLSPAGGHRRKGRLAQ